MTVSFLVTVHDELQEIKKLISYLLSKKDEEDEIIVLQDIESDKIKDDEVYKYGLLNTKKLLYYNYSLNNDFASFKNFGKNKCTKDWIFQIDCDEIPSSYLLENLKTILEANKDIELFWIPRTNIVKGITSEWIKKWGWRMTKLDGYNDLVNNWPDKQGRIFKNTKRICWYGSVHEIILGHETETNLPFKLEFALYHEKSLEKQIKQNEMYSKIVR